MKLDIDFDWLMSKCETPEPDFTWTAADRAEQARRRAARLSAEASSPAEEEAEREDTITAVSPR